MSKFWGSAHEDGQKVSAVSAGKHVEVDVAVGDDEDVRISAWGDGVDVEMVFSMEAAAATLRDVLSHAIKEDVWLV